MRGKVKNILWGMLFLLALFFVYFEPSEDSKLLILCLAICAILFKWNVHMYSEMKRKLNDETK